MSGLEAVALVLGVVPLLISALEHYDDLLKPLTRYKKFSSKIRDFHDQLYLERTLFRAECILLLGKRVARVQAETMLSDISHRSWRDETLERALSSMFGGMGEPCGIVMRHIIVTLGEISQKIKEFDAIGDQNPTGLEGADRNWRTIVRSKLKFSFMAHASLEKDLAKLGKLNKTFITLTTQVRQLDNDWKEPARHESQIRRGHKHRLQDYQHVRVAAADLFHTLAYSRCQQHHHLLRFDLEGVNLVGRLKAPATIVQFRVFFGQLALTVMPQQLETSSRSAHPVPSKGSKEELSMDIESALITDSGDSPNRLPGLPTAPVSNPEVSLQSSSTGDGAVPGDRAVAVGHKLCHGLSSTVDSPMSETGLGFSFTETRAIAQHKVTAQRTAASTEIASLAAVLSQKTKKGRTVELPLYHRFRIAMRLGSSMLQLHETPWLHAKFNSDAMYFASLGPEVYKSMVSESGKAAAKSLFVDISLDNGHEGTQTFSRPELSDASSDGKTPSVSRWNMRSRPANTWLFRLGILLLELAYHVPFPELLQEIEEEYAEHGIPTSSDMEVREYQIACHLADHVSAKLGAGYASVVMRCIRCDFSAGRSLELADPSFQEQIVETVIKKLEDLAAEVQRI